MLSKLETPRAVNPTTTTAPAVRPDRPAVAESGKQEQVITLATARDRQRLRTELFRVILRSELRRTGRHLDRPSQDISPTEGAAEPPSQAIVR